jgi:hypothetical protein
LNDAREMLRPREKMARLAFSFRSNSFYWPSNIYTCLLGAGGSLENNVIKTACFYYRTLARSTSKVTNIKENNYFSNLF